MKLFLKFIYSLQFSVILVCLSFSFFLLQKLFLKNEESVVIFFISNICISCILVLFIIYISLKTKFLITLRTDLLSLSIWFFTAYLLNLLISFFLVIGYFSFFLYPIYIIIILISTFFISFGHIKIKKNKSIDGKSFCIIKMNLSRNISDLVLLESTSVKDILYGEDYLLYKGKAISYKDINYLEETFGKKLQNFNQDEILTLDMYTII